MERLTLKEIVKACNARIDNNVNTDMEITAISTDTRKINKGDLFIALKGDNFDGHDFVKTAFEKGACAAVVKIGTATFFLKKVAVPILEVEDTLKALQYIAGFYRSKFKIPVVGITGSNGKTTTKEIAHKIISTKYKTLKNKGNFNNEIGVPLTLFNLTNEYRCMVVELATNNFGELKRLAEISKPDVGVVLNVGLSHIEFLKDIKGVAKAKQELVEMIPDDGVAILNSDDENVMSMKNKIKCRCITFGINKQTQIFASNISDLKANGMEFDLNIENQSVRISINLIGIHNVYNVLAASACAFALGFGINEIKIGLDDIDFDLSGRWKITLNNGIKIIDDTYNANPNSMVVSIKTFLNLNGTVANKRILVLGDMLELGDKGVELHKNLGNILGDIEIKDVFLFTYGDLAKYIAIGASEKGFNKSNIFSLSDKKEIVEYIRQIAKPGDSILVKGSHGMKMEEVVNALSHTVSAA